LVPSFTSFMGIQVEESVLQLAPAGTAMVTGVWIAVGRASDSYGAGERTGWGRRSAEMI
jgi:hypothetical protein